MGSTIIKEQSNQHHANDDMSLAASGVQNNRKTREAPKRKGSDSKYLSKEASEQYFNNIAQNKSKKKPTQNEKKVIIVQGNENSVMGDNIMKKSPLEKNPDRKSVV